MPEEQMTEQTVQIRQYRVTTRRDTLDKITGIDTSVFSQPARMRHPNARGEYPEIKNMVCAVFMDRATAEDIYWNLNRQRIMVLRNWLDPEGGPESVPDGAHGY